MSKIKKALAVSTIATAFGMIAVGCGTSSTTTSSNTTSSGGSSSASSTPTYNVGSDASYAPFEYVDSNQNIVGFDVDVLKAVAKAENFNVSFHNTAWKGIFLTLDQKTNDMLISAITITDERKQTMDFSDPYFSATQMIAYKKGSNLTTLKSLDGHKVGVQNGTTGDDIVTTEFGKTSTLVKRFDAMPLALQELQNGGVDAAVGDNGVVKNYVTNNGAGKFDIAVDPNFPKEEYGIAVKKGNTDLLSKINDGLKKIKADGTYTNIYKQWFGEAPSN